ncbi:MAG: energy transducer TonB [Flavobacteriales bacterium]|nr:energy transducer TonB [Flavobacteriales bacterium]MBK9196487.1 energy transducer TonB [Flavobacteriales bacterium]
MSLRIFGALFTLLLVVRCTAQGDAMPAVDLSVEPVHALVEQPPEYPGGHTALRNYLLNNMVFPEAVGKEAISGTVKVRFVVDRHGKVREPKIIFSLHPDVDGEALRLISVMPDWQPGRLREKPVNVMYVLPITIGG